MKWNLFIQKIFYNIYFWLRFIFVNHKSLKCTLKPVFQYKINFWICVLVLLIHKGYCVFKKLVWNNRIKAFWYTNNRVFLRPNSFYVYCVCIKKAKIFMVQPKSQIIFGILSIIVIAPTKQYQKLPLYIYMFAYFFL